MRVLVCGGREYSDWKTLSEALFKFLNAYSRDDLIIIQGAAKGADGMARHWCERYGVACMSFPANWNAHGKAAGPLRNAWMLREGRPNLVLAFPGGRGTADMVRRAEAAGIPVRRVEGKPT